MPPISTLFVEFRASTDKLNADLRAAQREVKQFEKAWAPTISVIETAVGAAAAAGLALAATVKIAADYGDKIRDAGIQTGLTTQMLSGLKVMAEQNGASFEDMNTGLKFLSKNFIAATEGGKEQQNAFAKLGIGVKDLKAAHGNLEPVMRQVMDRLKEMPSGAQKTAIELALLGKNGIALTEAFSQGSESLDGYIKLTRLLGTEVTPEAAAAADAFNDSINILKQATLGATVSIGNSLTPAATEFSKIAAAAAITAKDYANALVGLGVSAANATKSFLGEKGMNFVLTGLQSAIPGLPDLIANHKKLEEATAATARSQKAAANLAKYYADALGQTDEAVKAAAEAQKKFNEELFRSRQDSYQAARKAEADLRGLLDDQLDYHTKIYEDETKVRIDELNKQLKAIKAVEDIIFDAKQRSIKIAQDAEKDMRDDLDRSIEYHTKIYEDGDKERAESRDKILDGIKKAEKEAAESYQRIWEQATANITSDFVTAFSDVIFHAKSFMQAMKSLALSTAESMFKAFLTGLLSPLTSALSNLGRRLSDVLLRNGGILGKLGGIIGIGGATAGTASAAGTAGTVGAAGASGGLGFGSLAAFATNPITLAVAGAIAAGFAVHHFVGGGRRAANEFVNGKEGENAFGHQLGAIVDSFDSMKKAGSLTLDQAKMARDSAQELWRSFLKSNADFAAQGKTQAKVAEQSLDHLKELFGPNLQKVFAGMDTAIAGLQGSGGSGIPATGLASSATTRFAAAIDKLVPAIDSWLAPGSGLRASSIVITNEFAPANTFNFYGVPESLQQQIRDQIEPQIIADLKDNTRGFAEKVKDILGLNMGSAYSLDNNTFVELPVAPWNDPMLGLEEGENAFETNMAVRWIYPLFERDRWELRFILTKDQLQDFRDMHAAVGREPFYFRLTDASPAEYIYCRKEPGFMPRGTGEATEAGKPIFELRMTLIGETDPEEIEE